MSRATPFSALLSTIVVVAAVALAGALAGSPALAQQATLTLVPAVTLWNELVEARIVGTGCSGAFAPPVESVVVFTHLIDIDLLDCDAASTAPFATTVRIGPFYPGFSPYRVRVRNGPPQPGPSPPPPAVFDEVELDVHDVAPAFFVLPELATDAAPVSITTLVQRTAYGVSLDGPYVHGNVIELAYAMGGPIGVPPPFSPGLEPILWNLGLLAPGVYEVRLFRWDDGAFPNYPFARTTLVVHDADRCLPSATALCLGGGRFRVEAEWRDFAGRNGPGHPRPLDGDGASGLLWFFAPDNVELTAKLLDGCGLNGHFWFFLASGSTVEYTVTVTDTATGARRTYANASGGSAPLLSDTVAFPCAGP